MFGIIIKMMFDVFVIWRVVLILTVFSDSNLLVIGLMVVICNWWSVRVRLMVIGVFIMFKLINFSFIINFF